MYDSRERMAAAVANQNRMKVRPSNSFLYREIRQVDLTLAELNDNFDSNGLGLDSGLFVNWALCNGENGTPDLSDRFIAVGFDAPKETGGSNTMAHIHTILHSHEHVHTHDLAHTHSADHDHGVFGTGVALATTAVQSGAGTTVASDAHTHWVDPPNKAVTTGAASTETTSGASEETTGGASTGDSGGASNVENRPAYYKLVAVMWLG